MMELSTSLHLALQIYFYSAYRDFEGKKIHAAVTPVEMIYLYVIPLLRINK